MDKKQVASGFGLLLALAAIGTLLADGPREGLQRVMYVNGMMLMYLSSAVGARETCDADGPCRVRPATRWPTTAMFRTVVAWATAGWLTTSLLVGDVAWLTWFTAFAGLVVFGCVMLCLRWRFKSLVPLVLSSAAFLAFAHII